MNAELTEEEKAARALCTLAEDEGLSEILHACIRELIRRGCEIECEEYAVTGSGGDFPSLTIYGKP